MQPEVQSSSGVWGRHSEEGGVMFREEEASILERNRQNSTYELLLKKAVAEGRVGGISRCQVCGMRYNTAPEAARCCEKVLQHSRL